MTIFFKWFDEYSIGVPEIDQQHQHMFQLANEIQYSTPAEAKKYAEKLHNYTKYHFGVEESYFSEINSPILIEHLNFHNKLLEELISIINEGLSTHENLEHLKSFYLKWLVDHILYQDRKVIRYHRQ